MVENSVNQVPKVSKVFGVLSLVFSGLGIIGMVMIIIAAAMPSGRSVLIDSESAARLTVFFLGLCLGYISITTSDYTGKTALTGITSSQISLMPDSC